jgi:hypothetical protein
MAKNSEVFDVFDELRLQDSKMSVADNRRFSFSIPASASGGASAVYDSSSTVDGFDFMPDYDPLYDSNGDDGYTTEFYIGESKAEETYEDKMPDMDAYLEPEEDSIGVVKLNLADPISKLVSSSRTDKKFKIPSMKVKDARQIWIAADISDVASYNEIETKLLRWAEKNAEVRLDNGRGHGLIITWKSASGCSCTAKWYSFVRWILCASLSGAEGGAS